MYQKNKANCIKLNKDLQGKLEQFILENLNQILPGYRYEAEEVEQLRWSPDSFDSENNIYFYNCIMPREEKGNGVDQYDQVGINIETKLLHILIDCGDCIFLQHFSEEGDLLAQPCYRNKAVPLKESTIKESLRPICDYCQDLLDSYSTCDHLGCSNLVCDDCRALCESTEDIIGGEICPDCLNEVATSLCGHMEPEEISEITGLLEEEIANLI